MADDPSAPDYADITTRALEAPNFGQLQAAAYQAVNAMYAAAETPPAVLRWLMQYAADKSAIDATLQKFLCFIVVDPSLLALNGALAQADLATLEGVLSTLLGNFVAASVRANP